MDCEMTMGAQKSPGFNQTKYKALMALRLNTPSKVAEGDPELFDLLTNEKFSLPEDGLI